MKNKFFSMFDYLLILVVLTLVSLGVMFIYSSSINSEGVRVTNDKTDYLGIYWICNYDFNYSL